MTSEKISFDEFNRHVSVSRETYSRLEKYVALLEKWQKAINLVGPDTISNIWSRHIIDSAQLYQYISPEDLVLDIGSGAGLPGLVLAIMGLRNVTLVESDNRKFSFLREAARVTQSEVSIINNRAEAIDIERYNVVTARAFASITNLLHTIGKTLRTNHKFLLHKGKAFESEIIAAQEHWGFDYEVIPSITSNEGVILSMRHFTLKEAT